MTNHKQNGFALLEVILLVVVVGLIAGLGYFIVNQKPTATDNYSAPATRKTPDAASKKAVNTATIDSLADSAALEEAKLDDELSAEAEADSLDDQAAAKAVTEGIDEELNL